MSEAAKIPTDNPFAINFTDTEIVGVVRRTREFGDEGFVVVDLDGNRTAVGESSEEDADIQAGVAYRFFGVWTHHIKYGSRFQFSGYAVSERQAQLGVISFLSRSNLGLSRGDATRLWNAFGPDAVARLRDTPGAAAEAANIDYEKTIRASEILQQSTGEEQVRIALFELFGTHGFPRNTVKACLRTWGSRAPDIVGRDPFQMLVKRLPGVGFKRADKLYLHRNGNPLRLKRQMLAAWHWMASNGSGNTWEVASGLHRAILAATGSFDGSEFDRAVELGVRSGWLSCRAEADGMYYAERANAANEEKLAKHILRVMIHRAMWPEITEADLADAHQREKLAGIASSALAILAGTPGTGKTFTAAVLIRKLLTTIPAGQIAVCAPTGKAAVRITEAMRRYELPLSAATIHQTLEVDGNTHSGEFQFRRCEENPLDARIIVVDEASMLSTDLAASLFAAVPHGASVLLVGDPYQLPPVDHGAPLLDMIAAGVPCGELTEIKRNAGAIVTSCRAIKDGQRFNCAARVDEAAGMNLINLDASGEDDQLQTLVSLVGAVGTKGFDPIWDAQILCLTNDKSKVSRRPLNATLQAVLNPQDESIPVERRNPLYRIGDKVICLKNSSVQKWECPVESSAITDYRKLPDVAYIANGDMGRVLAVDPTSAVVQFLSPDRVVRIYTKKKKVSDKDDDTAGKLDWDLAYAITVHKSQGSEWPVVIVVIDEGAGPLGVRELIYTAISRAGRVCFLVGKIGTAWKWVGKVSLSKRKTFLAQLIRGDKQ